MRRECVNFYIRLLHASYQSALQAGEKKVNIELAELLISKGTMRKEEESKEDEMEDRDKVDDETDIHVARDDLG